MPPARAMNLAHDVDLIRIEDMWVHRSIPALFQQLAAEWPHEVNGYRRVGGEWQGQTVARSSQRVQHLAQGLLALGLGTGDRVGLVAATRPEWGQVDMATLHVGAVTVGIYPTLPAADVAYQLKHAGVQVVFVEDLSQLAKIEATRDSVPGLREVVLIEGEAEGALSLEALERRGAELSDGAARFEAAWRAVGPDDLATIIYTSGTTGLPKGAMLTHGNLTYTAHASVGVLPSKPGDKSVAFLPMAHALQRFASYCALLTRAVGYYTESTHTLMDDIRDVEPAIQVSVPRIWEKLYARLQDVLAAAPPTRRRVFEWGLQVGREVAEARRVGATISVGLRLRHAMAQRLVHDKIKARVFGRNIRLLTSGGAPIDVEILEYFEALGLLILEGWGLTETAAPATLNLPGAYRFGTVGRPIRGTEVRVAGDGELLVRGPGVFKGYYRDEEATAQAFNSDGFFKTGDIGEVDADGFVKITDRKKNLIVLSNGKKVAPQKLENHFQTISLIDATYVHGDRRSYLVGLFTLDAEETFRWAAAQGIVSSAEPEPGKLAELIAEPRVAAHLERSISARNAQLPRFEQLKAWEVLAEQWTTEDGTLTPTLKLKRRAIEARHQRRLDAFYDGGA